MANPEHRAKLKEGVKAWNKWREEDPAITADLVEANLRSANLEGANLRGANLERTNLLGANLKGADLRGADLKEAFLVGANLEKADLGSANLGKTNLRSANLGGTDFRMAELRGVKSLTVEQLRKVKTLYQAILDSELLEQIKEYCPRLLEKPEDEE